MDELRLIKAKTALTSYNSKKKISHKRRLNGAPHYEYERELEIIDKCLLSLPDSYRTVLIGFYVDDIRPREKILESINYEHSRRYRLRDKALKVFAEVYGDSRSLVERISIKYFDRMLQEVTPLEKIGVGDWIDLRSAERVELKAGEYKLLRLGVGMILPDGYEAHVLPRSSTPSKFGIMCANSMGVIDNSYSGDADEWKFPAVAIRDTVIEKGDRIAQFRIVKNQPAIEFITVEHLNEKSRGGIGSTGTR